MATLATRCGSCGTSFRVSEDQLAISDGFVRCGRCDAVFNAREALFDLDAAPVSAPMPLTPMAPRAPAVPEPLAADLPVEAAPAPEEPQWLPEPTAAPVDERPEPQWQAETVAAPTPVTDPNQELRHLLGVEAEPAPAEGLETAAAASWPSLGQRPARAPRRGSTWTLAAGGLLAALLALALPLQWAWIEREALRARSPQLDALLRAHLPSLRSEGLRRLDGLSVASSSLLATPQGGAYQLELLLHNRAEQALAMPWLDLRLSDAQGRVLLRRAVPPAELAQAAPLRPGEQRRLQAVFRLRGAPEGVSGYEVGLFHP